MLYVKYWALVTLATAAANVAFAKPSGIALSVVKDRTICKTEVYYNEDQDRIPSIIKELKCAEKQPAECFARGRGGMEQCCERGSWSGGPQLRCAEVLDTVLVNHNMKGKYIMNVRVGCACIRQESNEAIELK